MCERFVSNPGAPRNSSLACTYLHARDPRAVSRHELKLREPIAIARARGVFPLSTLMVLRAPRRAHHRRITQGGITRLITREKLNIETINRRRGEAPCRHARASAQRAMGKSRFMLPGAKIDSTFYARLIPHPAGVQRNVMMCCRVSGGPP